MFPHNNFPPFSQPPIVPPQQLYNLNPLFPFQQNQLIRQPFISPQAPLSTPDHISSDNMVLPQQLYLPNTPIATLPPHQQVDMSHIMQRVNFLANSHFEQTSDRSHVTIQRISSSIAAMIQQAGLDQRDPEFLLKLEPFRKMFISMLSQNGILNDASPALFEQFFLASRSSHTASAPQAVSVAAPFPSESSSSSSSSGTQNPSSAVFSSGSLSEFKPPPPPQPPREPTPPPPPPPVPLLTLSLSPPPSIRATMPPSARPIERKSHPAPDQMREPHSSRVHSAVSSQCSFSRVPIADSKEIDALSDNSSSFAKESLSSRPQSAQEVRKDIPIGRIPVLANYFDIQRTLQFLQWP